MIYYDGILVNYKDLDNDESGKGKEVASQIAEIQTKFFGKNATGYAVLRFPNGTRKQDEKTGMWYPAKPYCVFHKSQDRMWVYSTRKKTTINDVDNYGDAFTVIRDPYVIQKKDIEFLWFLVNHCTDVKAKRIFIEDLEEKAEKQARDMASDVDIRFMIYGKSSPFANSEELFRKIATSFGVKDANRKGFYQIKNDVYSLVSDGEKNGSRFINYEVFEKLVNGKRSLRAAYIIRTAIEDGTLKYSTKDFKWFITSGGELVEPVFSVKLADVAHKEELLIEAVLNDAMLRGTIYSALGVRDFDSVEELREFSIQTLRSMVKNYGEKVDTKDSAEELVKKLCAMTSTEYREKSSVQ